MMSRWEDLPDNMRLEEVRPYYDVLQNKKVSLFFKRLFDIVLSLMMLVVLISPMLILAIWIKSDSKGPVFYRQERVTTNGRHFRIHKFRTMVSNADQIGTSVTVGNDSRITNAGSKLRRLRIDELPQLIDVLVGDMSFVGTRPEAVKYVDQYKPEYMATLLLPAGITSEASIRYKDEDKLLDASSNVDKAYMEEVLPEKMKYNLESIRNFNLVHEIRTMGRTALAVLGKNYE